MGMVAAICTQCGASIEVDESKEAGICSHCGTAFITEKVINNYHIHNTTNVTNKIEHATINVKNGDDASDETRRYRAFIKQKKYTSAVKLLDKMEEKYPDSGLVQYCKADFYLTAKNYVDWTNWTAEGAKDEVLDDGAPALVASEFFDANSAFDLKKLSEPFDEFDALSDDEIRSRLKKKKVYKQGIDPKFFCGKDGKFDTEYKIRRLLWYCVPEVFLPGFGNTFDWTKYHCGNETLCIPSYNSYKRRYETGENWDKYYFYNKNCFDEEDFDPSKYDSIDAFVSDKSNVGYADLYKRALFYSQKSAETGDSLLTDAEREQFADFLREVKEKYEVFKAFVERRDKAKTRVLMFRDELREKYKKELKKHSKKCKRMLKSNKTNLIAKKLKKNR